MRAKPKLVSFVLCALLMFGFALTANAQIQHTVSSNPNEVVQYGLTELMGEFRLTWSATTAVIGSTITITYQGVSITNASSTSTFVNTAAPGGIIVTAVGYAGATFTSIGTTGSGGQVVISIPSTVTPGAGSYIAVNGVRADVSAKPVGSPGGDILASLSSSPSNAHTFLNASVLRVATVNSSMTLTVTGVTDAICLAFPPNQYPTVRVKEGFAGVFVQYNTTVTTPLNPRIKYGATGNTQVRIVVSTLPAGVTLTWPTPVNIDLGGGQTSSLNFVSQSGTGNTTVVYDYTTTDQGRSDSQQETFIIIPQVGIDPATAVTGQSTVQAQLYPGSTSTTVIRFNHPLIPDPGLNFVLISKCVTNLLFPFVANVSGYDTGIAIADTSYDVMAITPTTTPQSGPVTLYLYPQFAEPGPVTPPATYTVANVSAGNTWAGSMSQIPAFAGKVGYIIAVAQFQYAHGFAFISLGGSSGLVLAEGYTANVIPDVSVTLNRRLPDPAATAGSGENIGH